MQKKGKDVDSSSSSDEKNKKTKVTKDKGKDADFYGSLLSASPDEDRIPGHYHSREEDFMEMVKLKGFLTLFPGHIQKGRQ